MPFLQFYKSTAKKHTEQVPILCRFYVGRVNQRAKTHISAPASLWDDTLGACRVSRRYETLLNKQARETQTQLDDLREYIMQQYYNNKSPELPQKWLQMTIESYYKPTSTLTAIAELVPLYCTAKQLAPSTCRKNMVLVNLLHEYQKDKGTTLYLETLTTEQIETFSAWLAFDETTRTYKRAANSIVSRLKLLHAICRWRGISPDPFLGFQMPQEKYGTPIYITREERDYLTIFPDLSESKKIQRDIFIFQCHVGCRIDDLYRLTKDNITADGWLVYMPQKTATEKTLVEVPLSDVAKAIIERYSDPTRTTLLPFISKVKYNDAIKYIFRAAALNRSVFYLDPRTRQTCSRPLFEVVSSHTARKTFTQILYSTITDKRLVASMTGHSENSHAFNRYSEIDKQMKRHAIDMTNK